MEDTNFNYKKDENYENDGNEKPFIDECNICLTKKKIDFTCYTCKTCKICKKCMYKYKIYKREKCPTCHSIDWLRCAFFEFDAVNDIKTIIKEEEIIDTESTDEDIENMGDREYMERENILREEEYEVNKIMSQYLENRVSDQFSIHVLNDTAHYQSLGSPNSREGETTPLRRNRALLSRRRRCECNLYTSIFYIIVGAITIYLVTLLALEIIYKV